MRGIRAKNFSCIPKKTLHNKWQPHHQRDKSHDKQGYCKSSFLARHNMMTRLTAAFDFDKDE